MTGRLRHLPLVFTLALVGALAQAGTLDDIRTRGAIRVATTFDYRPFSYRTETGPAGIDVEFAQQLGAALGARVVWVETTWATLLDDLRAGTFDVAMSGISVTPARSEVGLFAEPYFHTGKTVLARCAVVERLHTLADIDRPTVTVIVNPGGSNEAFVNTHLHRARIARFPDNLGIFAALAGGAADLMVTDAVEAEIESRRHPGLCAVPGPPWLEPIDKAWLIGKDPAWKRWLDAFVARLQADGSLAALIDRNVAAAAEPVAQ